MPEKKIKGSLSGIVDKMNKKYDGLIGEGFNLGLDRRVVPVMSDGMVKGWKMQSMYVLRRRHRITESVRSIRRLCSARI